MKLLEAFDAATKEDLEELRKTIADAEMRLAALHKVERLLAIRFDDPKPRAAAQPRAAVPADNAFSSNEKRRKIAMYLMANGPKSQVKLSEVLGISRQGRGCLSSIIAGHEWFHVAPDGMVSVTGTGETEIRKS